MAAAVAGRPAPDILELIEAFLEGLVDLPVSSDPYDAITLLFSLELNGVNKTAWIDNDGKPQKRAAQFQSEYLAVKVPVAGHPALQRILETAAGFDWLTFLPGILSGTAFYEPHLVVSTRLLDGNPAEWHRLPGCDLPAIGRVASAFVASNWRPFDRDHLPRELRRELSDPCAWWRAMGVAIPVLAGARVAIVPSTTGRILWAATGKPAFDQGHGLHAWVRMQNGPRCQAGLVSLKRSMRDLTTLAGLGQREQTAAGGNRYDGIWDPSNFSTERPCFDGAPSVGDGLAVAPPAILELNPDGPDVDLSRLSQLSDRQMDKVARARAAAARDAARWLGLKRHSVDRQGRVKPGRGKAWMRLLNGLGSTSACRDVLLAVASAAAKAGIPREDFLKEIDRRVAAPSPLLLRDDGLVLSKLRGYRDDPDELEQIVEWAWENVRREVHTARRPAWQHRVDRRELEDSVQRLEQEMPEWQLKMMSLVPV